MGENTMLTLREREAARRQAVQAVRARLETTKPNERQYGDHGDRAATVISNILSWSKAFVPVIALLAALASAVRTVQTAAEIYSASGSAPVGVLIAAISFTLSAEGALFVLALAQEGQRLKWRAERRPRAVGSLRSVWRGLLVRIGVKEALRHDELPERDNGLSIVMWIAFVFAVASNAYLGLRPLLAAVGSVTLQDFIRDLVNAPAATQMTFIVDLAAVLFPPFMARQAGHLTARFAAEVAAARAAVRAAYEADLAAWRQAYSDPLATPEGQELLTEIEREKIAAKQARQAARPTPPLPPTPVSGNGRRTGGSAG